MLSSALGSSDKRGDFFALLPKMIKLQMSAVNNTRVIEARGKDKLESIIVANVDKNGDVIDGTQKEKKTELLAIGNGLVPNLDVATLAGCQTLYDGTLILNPIKNEKKNLLHHALGHDGLLGFFHRKKSPEEESKEKAKAAFSAQRDDDGVRTGSTLGASSNVPTSTKSYMELMEETKISVELRVVGHTLKHVSDRKELEKMLAVRDIDEESSSDSA